MIDEVLSSETHWWFFFAGTIAFFWLMVEGGYWVGRWRREHVDPEQADIAAAARPRSVPVGLYIDALNDVIDRHEERVTVSLHYRIPPSLIWTLYLVALLSMVVMGLNFGLAGTRNLLASLALVLAFAAVLLLIVDLDQVHQHLFTVDQSPLTDTQASIHESMNGSTAVGGGPETPDAPAPPLR